MAGRVAAASYLVATMWMRTKGPGVVPVPQTSLTADLPEASLAVVVLASAVTLTVVVNDVATEAAATGAGAMAAEQ